MTKAGTTHANAPDAVPRPSDAHASGGGDDAASAAKAGAKTGTARSGSSSSFSAEELASLDAVREDAVRRYTRALAPKLGEKTYGHSEREAERFAALLRLVDELGREWGERWRSFRRSAKVGVE